MPPADPVHSDPMSQRRRRRAPLAQRIFAILALLVIISMILALILPSAFAPTS
jgi:hypothetical protein